MFVFWLFDVLLLVILAVYGVYGYLNGFIHSLSAFVGLAVGAFAAFFAMPLVGEWVPSQQWRVLAVLAVGVGLVLGGQAAGLAIGRVIRRRAGSVKPVRIVDRIVGCLASLVATALVLSLLTTSITALGVPYLSGAIANSTVLKTIRSLTPDPVASLLAQIRSAIVTNGLPAIAEALGGVTTPPPVPRVDTNGAAVAAAGQSVVRVTGNAYACGQAISGSGFVVATNRIVTNAHVVAGVSDPVVETRGGQALAGRVVYFDASNDLAVIAVKALHEPTLSFTANLAKDAVGVVDGYPFGGPFVSDPAKVLSVQTDDVKNIYGTGSNPRQIYTLAASVREGDSGGPLLDQSGAVAGIVFARSGTVENVGYAITMTELTPVVNAAPALTSRVSTGACLRG